MRRLGGLLAIALLAAACGDDSTPPTADPHPAIGQHLEAALAHELAQHPELPGEILLVHAPGFDLTTAQGRDAPDGEPLTVDHVIRVASVTKTFTAATVLRLVEEGELDLDDPAADHLGPEFVRRLAADGYDLDAITVRLLLGHLAGLYDYAQDDAYAVSAVNDPHHRWTPLEQIRFAVDHGDPVAQPGEVFHYSDTGYVLLGQVIEQASGLSLAEAYRQLLDLDGLGLDHTWLETLEPAPADPGPMVHQIFAELDLTDRDPSFDLYGGGGLVSTVADIARFYEALFGGEVFEDPASLDTMTAESPPSGPDRAGMGLFRVNAAGHACYEHSGFWGTVAFHCPDLDLTIVRHVGQALPADDYSFADLNILTVSQLDDV